MLLKLLFDELLISELEGRSILLNRLKDAFLQTHCRKNPPVMDSLQVFSVLIGLLQHTRHLLDLDHVQVET